MKKLVAFIIISVAMVSCYEDYILDYEYTGIYFPYQLDVRTFVVGEGMKIEVGAALGGVRENKIDRNVTFALRYELITPDVLTKMKNASQAYISVAATPVTAQFPMPANYYSISNPNTMVIRAGQHMGSVVIRADSVNFLQDSLKTRYATYIMPFYIVKADADSILTARRSNLVSIMFENMLFGNYWHGGAAVVKRPGKTDTTYVYKTTIPTAETKIWNLKTLGPRTLVCNGFLDQTTSKNEMILVLDGNKIRIGKTAQSSFSFEGDGESVFNRAKLLQNRKLFLKYKYTNPGNGYTYLCTDTLTFRNRIRDGVNEWQDENPSHYR